tara:strand:+ start:163 stop:450 length:288 start_codon:yes stop_codon:yes gene_type:complete
MRLFINKILIRFFAFIGKPQLSNRFCFDQPPTFEYWKTGNRTFLSSGKYMNGKKHGEFRKYDSEGNFQEWEIYEEGKLMIKVPSDPSPETYIIEA